MEGLPFENPLFGGPIFRGVFFEEFILQGNALDRLTEPDDIAPMVTLLASGLADHATGTSIDINAASYVH